MVAFHLMKRRLKKLSQAAACDGTKITTTAEGQEIAVGTLPTYLREVIET